MILKTGQRLASVTDSTEVIIVRAGKADISLTCGGLPMTDAKSSADKQPAVDTAGGGGALGKRYVDANGTVELLCTKAGQHPLAIDGAHLHVKDAKPLPASD